MTDVIIATVICMQNHKCNEVTSALLGFWKFQIFKGCDAQEGRTASACQILSISLKPRLRYGDFSIFQDGRRPPSWIGFTRVGTTRVEYLVVFVTVQIWW